MSTLGVPEGYAVLMRLVWTRNRQGTLGVPTVTPGVPTVTPGVPRPGAKTLILLVHYLKGVMAHSLASISVSETLKESPIVLRV